MLRLCCFKALASSEGWRPIDFIAVWLFSFVLSSSSKTGVLQIPSKSAHVLRGCKVHIALCIDLPAVTPSRMSNPQQSVLHSSIQFTKDNSVRRCSRPRPQNLMGPSCLVEWHLPLPFLWCFSLFWGSMVSFTTCGLYTNLYLCLGMFGYFKDQLRLLTNLSAFQMCHIHYFSC